MAVYFKFTSAKDFDSVSIDGHFISVAKLKEKIVERKNLGRASDCHLVISNAQTNEEYTNEGFLVPNVTSVIVRRAPRRPSVPIVADVKDSRKSSVGVLPPVSSGFQSAPYGLDNFGDLHEVPEVVQAPKAFVDITEEEDKKIRAFVDASANDWQQQIQESYSWGKGYGNKCQGKGLPLRGGYVRGFENKNPPHGYVCRRCGVTGHYIQHCPTNGDPTYDLKKVRPPTGIPKTMLVADVDGSYALPTGELVVYKPNEAAFDSFIDGLPSSIPSRPILDIPPELCCPLCKGVLKEAVVAGKCCFKSYCDKCIRNEIISKAKCVCGAKNLLADDLLPNRTLRDAINRFLESQATAIDPVKQGMEFIDGSPESELTEESVQETVSTERSARMDIEPQDQEPTISKLVKGIKKPKGKRARHDMAYSDGMWEQGPDYNNSQLQAENCCMHFGSYGHPFWNCHLINNPWPSYHAPSMQGPMFGLGFNPQMRGTMHQPMCEGYVMMPHHQNRGPYNAYGFSPYDSEFRVKRGKVRRGAEHGS